MPSTAEIIRRAEALPVEERAVVVDSLLRALNPPDPEIDRKWADLELQTSRQRGVQAEA